MKTSGRISIPRKADAMIALASEVLAAHQALGNESPLVNSVDMAMFESTLNDAIAYNQQAKRLKMDAEKAVQLRNNALGIAKGMHVGLHDSLLNLLTRVKAVLKGTHLSAIQTLGDFGFEVNRSPRKKMPGIEQNLTDLSANDTTGLE